MRAAGGPSVKESRSRKGADENVAALPIILKWRRGIMQSGLPSTTRLVLHTLSCFMNNDGSDCYPTTAQVAEASGLSERAVCTHIAQASDKGWLRVSVKKTGQWKRHQYRALWPGLTERGSVDDPDDNTPLGPKDDGGSTERGSVGHKLNKAQKEAAFTERGSVNGRQEATSGEAAITERGSVSHKLNKAQKKVASTEPRSVDHGANMQPELHLRGCKALNEVQYVKTDHTPCDVQITPPVTPRSQGYSLNVVPVLTEPDDKNPLNDVQCTSPYTSPYTSPESARVRGPETDQPGKNRSKGLRKTASGPVERFLPKVVSSRKGRKTVDADAAKQKRLAERIAKLPKHEREAAWLAAMEGRL